MKRTRATSVIANTVVGGVAEDRRRYIEGEEDAFASSGLGGGVVF
ncbi:MAG: hypothetical protein ABIU76_05630 [Gemmatimonadaceae bacterium]